MEILGRKLVSVNDYQLSIKRSLENNETEPIRLPKSNVLKFVFEGSLGIVVRPSGTEPKLKIYYTIKADSKDEANALAVRLAGKNGTFAALAIR